MALVICRAGNRFHTYRFIEFNCYNGALFNIRARSLNNLVYWISQIIGSLAIGFLLDHQNISRRARAFAGWGVLFAMVFIVHIWTFFYQRCVFCLQSYRCSRHIGTTPENLFLLTRIKWIYMTPDTSAGSGRIFSAAFLMPCGKQPPIGSWELCPTTPLN